MIVVASDVIPNVYYKTKFNRQTIPSRTTYLFKNLQVCEWLSNERKAYTKRTSPLQLILKHYIPPNFDTTKLESACHCRIQSANPARRKEPTYIGVAIVERLMRSKLLLGKHNIE